MRQFLLLALTIITTRICLAQESIDVDRGMHIALETGYSIPAKESFRSNYDQSLFVTNVHAPFSMALEIGYPLSETVDAILTLERKNYHLASTDDISIAVMPALIGLQYHFSKDQINFGKFSPYAGLCAGWYWARFSAQLPVTQQDPTILELRDESMSYFGFGTQINIGVDDPLSDHVSLGLDVRYDINSLGSVDEGGLGNLGGFLFGLKFTYGL
jgi:outer membrane protein W